MPNKKNVNRRRRYAAPPPKKRRKRRRKKRSILPVILTIVIVLLVIGGLGGYFLWQRYSYGTDRADLNRYFGVTDASSYQIYLAGEETGAYAKRFDGTMYLSLDDLHTFVSSRFYYGAADGVLIYTTPTESYTAEIGSNILTSSAGETEQFPYIIARYEGDSVYVAVNYACRYHNIVYTAYDDPNHMMLYTGLVSAETARITKETSLRALGGVKSDILKDLEEGERVVILDESLGDWIKVRTEDAYTGYVESRRLSGKETTSYGTNQIPDPVYTSIQKPYRICLGWHYIAGEAGNDTLEDVTAQANGLNTISPTWFRLSDNEGNISSLGSADYVRRAHAMGLEVWALVSSFEVEGVDASMVLSRTSSRTRLIDNLMREVSRLSLDGINIDFEALPESSGPDFVQFIRELSIACRNAQIVLSIDNYIPYNFRSYYGHEEQGIVADYVVIMGYDEHVAGSDEAGSVASIGYVSYGIAATAEIVPPEKIINAVPFYTRLWTTRGGAVISAPALDMRTAQENIDSYHMETAWDAETEQYYGAVTLNNGDLVQIWVEDAESLAAKIAVMNTYGLGGIAAWQLGYETPDVWSVISRYVYGN